ncbi:MAG: hypothetical protein R3B99_01660 [Polyangiales bacterium]
MAARDARAGRSFRAQHGRRHRADRGELSGRERCCVRQGPGPIRVLDVGGNGTLARARGRPASSRRRLRSTGLEPLARATYRGSAAQARLGFRAGDVFRHALPEGYDDHVSFVRILHDWPANARRLLAGPSMRWPPGAA